jgi:uncharacterized protein (UPF0264 family)
MKSPARRNIAKLLVSVRDAAEAEVALAAGADLIDIKEPRHGALGAAAPGVIQHIVRAIAGRALLSVALGELADWPNRQSPISGSLGSIQFAKLGLAGMAADRSWRGVWSGAWSQLPPSLGRVAVAYADWQTAQAPSPSEITSAATSHSCAAVLLDTFDKSAGSLTDLWSVDAIAGFIDAVRRAGMLCVIAGSLSPYNIGAVAAVGPDYVAVRGAACEGGRDGPISAACIYTLRRAISRPSPKPRWVTENA